MIASCARNGRRPREILVLLVITALAGFLRLRDLELVEFKADEAIAVDLARGLLAGDFPTVGLKSSIGAHNAPLFVYLTAIPLAVRDDPLAATASIGVLSIAAVILAYVVLRPRFGALVALGATALFATAPWAVLYGRKLWGQSVLPVVNVMLVWAMFAVLERRRSRTVALVPVLLCVAFQLNFSALALAVPSTVLLLYRAREVHWRAFAAGVGVAALLLAPWLVRQVDTGFDDVSALLPGARAEASEHAEWRPVEAVRQSVRLVGVGDWEYVAADSLQAFVADARLTWKVARGASMLAAALFAVGVITCAVFIARGMRLGRRRPWVELSPMASSRALLLVWLGGVWLVSSAPLTDRLYPHYLITTFPVCFAVPALGLADLVGFVRSGLGRAVRIGAVAALVTVSTAYAAFTVAFHGFLDKVGGTAGDYGVVYRDKDALADDVRARGFRVDQPVLDFLVTGELNLSRGDLPLVTVTDRMHNVTPLCGGELRSFGQLDACFPPS